MTTLDARVVVLQPDPCAGRALSEMLGARFAGVDVVSTWHEALAALRAEDAAALVVDVDAGAHETTRLCAALDRLGLCAELPTVALLEAGGAGAFELPTGLAGAALLQKPVRARLLSDMLARLVDARQSPRAEA